MTLIFTPLMFQLPNTNIASLYCQGSIVSGITNVGRTPTTKHDQLYPFLLLLVYNINLMYDLSIFHPPGKQDHLTINLHFQLGHHNKIHTKEVDLNLLEFRRTNNLPSWYPVFQIP